MPAREVMIRALNGFAIALKARLELVEMLLEVCDFLDKRFQFNVLYCQFGSIGLP